MNHNSLVGSIAFSPDGKYVVSSDQGDANGIGTVIVWETTTGAEVSRKTHNGSITSVTFSPNGKTIVSASGNIILV